MANLATMVLNDTLAVLQTRDAMVSTTCSSAWWADRAKIRTTKQRQSDGVVGQTAAVLSSTSRQHQADDRPMPERAKGPAVVLLREAE